MKEKKNLYFLIPAVCFIWGVIIYRIVDFSDGTENPIVRNMSVSDIQPSNTESNFRPSFNYPDPFLKNLDRASKLRVEEKKDKAEEVQPTLEVLLPQIEIEYRGFVRSTNQRQKVALLVVENEEVFMNVGDIHKEVIVKKILNDSVLVNWQDQSFYIKKSFL